MWMKVGPDTIVGPNQDVGYFRGGRGVLVGLHATPGLNPNTSSTNSLSPCLTSCPYDCTRPPSGNAAPGSSFCPEKRHHDAPCEKPSLLPFPVISPPNTAPALRLRTTAGAGSATPNLVMSRRSVRQHLLR